jgi:hypothetical protein
MVIRFGTDQILLDEAAPAPSPSPHHIPTQDHASHHSNELPSPLCEESSSQLDALGFSDDGKGGNTIVVLMKMKMVPDLAPRCHYPSIRSLISYFIKRKESATNEPIAEVKWR